MKRRPFGSILQRPPRPGFYVTFTWEGRRIKRSAGPTKAAARKKLTAAEALLKSGVDLSEVLAEVFGDFHGTRLTFRDAAPLYLDYAQGRKKESTLQVDVPRLRVLCRSGWSAKYLAEIRAADFMPWIAERQKSRDVTTKKRMRGKDGHMHTETIKKQIPGASGATVNRDLTLASAVFQWAVRLGYVDDNPVRKVERFSEKGRKRETFLTAKECHTLIEECSPVLRPVVLAAVHTGMRRGEILSLAWRTVDLKRGEIHIEAANEKAGRGRVIPLTDNMKAILKGMKESRPRPALDGSDPVFTGNAGRAIKPSNLLRMFMLTVGRCEGLPVAKRESLRFHDLRHTAASLMIGASVPIFDVAKILGHSTLAVTMRYAHFAPEAGRAAIGRLGDALSAVPRAVGSAASC